MVNNTANINVELTVSQKVKAFVELMKMRLSLLVAFSSAFGYALAMGGRVDWMQLAALFVGGWLVSGASCTVNQVLEKDYDRVMKRTQNRPLPTERLSNSESLWFALVVACLGIGLLWVSTNLLTVGLSLLSMVLYSFVYTPLKRVGPIAVFVGAFPGALPPLLGWTAATGSISHEALIIFGIQFIWQFPHFWAIAWVADDDYKKAGFKLLPVKGEKDMKTAFQIMTYTLFLIPLGLLPTYFGLTGINSAVVATVCGVLFLASTIKLMRDQSRKSALRIMFGSFLYLPIVQIAYLLDMVK
ncbi:MULTISPECIES: heme o synthase [Roseivirga]|uniref:Protoheme IX farnesyltransferase n=1 Tax=Roseivirga thermotolerans TaxID=1758176 RepID=A0ABQ3IBD1_9BACT|nr:MULTISPECIES: heme o synthase [Roseivirga]MEC7752390.1 heme o synthase [Bacteroidota bacterium]GHE67876.1 protoheme IX farnesyltransferase [Roseivirga thermotolerans]|tara:strand:+ start:13021 stop:13920 length:900 start_codon:yes stop_codon:yes gene_type:complete